MGARRHREYLSPAEARELFRYDPETGELFWRKNSGKRRAGDLVSSAKGNGYLQVETRGYNYLVHRLAWAIVSGTWPENHIDHIDGDRQNNRWSNLRDVPQFVNTQNVKRARSDNKLGLLGVCRPRDKRKYRAVVQKHGRVVHRSYHHTPEEAHAVYLEAKRKHHEGNTL